MSPFDYEVDGYWFIASPYERYAQGKTAAFRDVCKITGPLLKMGLPVFSPIAHGHAIEYESKVLMSPNEWHKVNLPLLERAGGLVVLQLPGWGMSRGMAKEIEYAERMGKTIVELSPEIVSKGNSQYK